MIYTCAVYLSRLGWLTIAAFAIAACSAQAVAQDDARHVQEAAQVELDAIALDVGTTALNAFKGEYPNWRCFYASIYQQDGNWRVDFIARDDVRDDGDTMLVGASKCGKGASYLIDQTGKIVRTIYAR